MVAEAVTVTENTFEYRNVTGDVTTLGTAALGSRPECGVLCENTATCDAFTTHGGRCSLYKTSQDACSPITNMLYRKTGLPDVPLNLCCPRKDIKNPHQDLVALEDGGALISDSGWSPPRLYHIDNQGVVVPPWVTLISTSIVGGLLLDRSFVFAIQLDGWLTRVPALPFNMSAAESVDMNTGKLLTGCGCVDGPNTILVPDHGLGVIYQYNFTTKTKLEVKSDLLGIYCVTRTGVDANTIYLVIRWGTQGKIWIFNQTWALVRKYSGAGLYYPRKAVFTSKNSLLVANDGYIQVTELNITSRYLKVIRQVATEEDGIGKPFAISLSGQHLWVTFSTSPDNTYNAVRFSYN